MPHLNGLFYADHQAHESATPLILIHGAGSNHLTWPKEIRRMVGRRVIALDLPAHGRSEGEASQTMLGYAQAVIQLLDALKIPNAIFMGHSMGGGITQTIALHFPDRCKGLILVATGAKLPVNSQILALARENFPEAAKLINKWSWSPDAAEAFKVADLNMLLSNPSEVIYRDYVACNTFDVSDQLSQLNLPTLLLYGTNDKMTPLAWGEFLAEGLPQAQLKTLEGAGHMVFLEQSVHVADEIGAWLKEQGL